MFKKLTKREITDFAKKYLPIWKEEIQEVSVISYHFVKEYLVNNHYFVIVKPFKVIKKEIR